MSLLGKIAGIVSAPVRLPVEYLARRAGRAFTRGAVEGFLRQPRREENMSNGTVKPGWKTTEFWLSVVAALVGLLLASGLVPEASPLAQVIGAVASALTALGYSVGRGLAKRGG